jgi:colicin import membrane protein
MANFAIGTLAAVRLGLIISVALHTALLAWALVSLSAPRTPDMPETIPVAVDLVTPSELDRMRQGSEQAKLMEAAPKEAPQPEGTPKELPKPKQVTPPPPPPVAGNPPPPPPPPPEPAKAEPPPKAAEPVAEKLAAATPPPEPGPSLEQLKLKEEQLKAEAEAEAKRKAEEEARRRAEDEAKRKADEEAKRKAEEDRRKAIARKKAEDERRKKLAEEKRKKQFEDVARRLQALEDKAPPKEVAAAAPDPSTPTKAKGPVLGSPKGADTQLSASERSILLGKIVGKVKECWNINAGMEGASSLVPVVTFELNRDGSVRGIPRVTNPQPSPQFRDAADSAVRAIMQCQNYDLPADKYEAWEIVTLKFDPSQMFR